jgi:formate-dependent nitrite reductase cytochrome c552 subunit
MEGPLGKSFALWKASVHRKEGVTCDRCHGGEARASKKSSAHQGLRPPSDPRAPTYYRNVPITCGSCHKHELDAFFSSEHYRELITGGRGPNCVTCHGSKKVYVPNPEDFSSKCSICHNRRMKIWPMVPGLASQSLKKMRETRALVDWTDRFLDARQKMGHEVDEAKRLILQGRQEVQKASRAWHSFNLSEVEKRVEVAQERALEAGRLVLSSTPPASDPRSPGKERGHQRRTDRP